MKLYYSPDTSSLAEHIVLEWIGEPYEIQKVEIRPDKSPELLARNPMGAVPVLEVGDWVLTQNVAILNYLADCAPELRLAGDGTKRGRAEINRWLGFINSDMHPLFEPFFGSTSYLGDEAHVEATKSHSRQLLADRFAIVDTHLKNSLWLGGSDHSIADAYLYVLSRAAPQMSIDLSSMGNLLAFHHRMEKDPAVVRVLQAEHRS